MRLIDKIRKVINEADTLVDEAVRELINTHPELDPKEFGISDCLKPVALFMVWDFVRMLAEGKCQDTGSIPKSMELMSNYELVVTDNLGTFVVDSCVVIEETRYVLKEISCYLNEYENVLKWLWSALKVKKELGDLTGDYQDRVTLWRSNI